MQILGDAVAASPEIEINRLNWILSNDEDPKDADNTALGGTSTEKRSAAVPFVLDKNVFI